MKQDEHKNDQNGSKPGFWSLVVSTCAAAFGVQTRKNHERDFAAGDIKVFIVAGVVFTLVFIAVIYGLVQLVINLAA